MAINPLDLDIIEDCTISATVDVDAIVSGTLDLTGGEARTGVPSNNLIQVWKGYEHYVTSIGSITNDTTGLSIISIVAVYTSNWGNERIAAVVRLRGDYTQYKVSIYDATTNAVLFPETPLKYISTIPASGAEVLDCDLIDLLANNVGKTVSLKVVIK